MSRFNYCKFIFLIILALFIAFISLGKAYPTLYSPLDNQGTFNQIDADRWILDGAEIKFNNLLSRGNKVTFHFSTWHPENMPAPQLQVYVCDQLASQFVVTPGLEQDVYLRGDCEPRVIRIQSTNAFVASEGDPRPLIAKLDFLNLSAKSGLVFSSPSIIFQVAGALLLIFIVLINIFPTVIAGSLITLVTVGGYCLISEFYFSNQIVLGNFYLFLILFLLGLLVARFNFRTNLQFPYFPKAPLGNSLLIILIFILGACLRFYDIDFGLPANYHPDEVPKYNAIERMRHFGDFNPRYFLHPTLLLYSAYFFNFLLRFFTNLEIPWMDTLILAGRMMSATAGSLSILLTALIARRLFNNYAAVISAFLIAVFPLHVTCSRYLKEDALLVFFILLAVYLVIRSVQENRAGGLLLAGLVAGFSASVKYTGLVSIMILVAAPFLKSERLVPDKEFLKWTVRAIFVLPLGFLLASPYTLLDLGKFLQDFNYERSHMATGHDGLITAGSQIWTYHLARSLWAGMEPVALAFGVIGLGYLLYQNKIKYWYIIALFLLYYIPAEYVKAKPAPQPERYVVPCLPFLAIAIGVLISELTINARRFTNKILLGILMLLVVSFPAVRSWQLARDLKPDTRDLMSQWVDQNIPAGSKILIDLPAYQAPIAPDKFQVSALTRNLILEELSPESLRKSGGDYLLLSSLFYDRYFSQPGIPPQLRGIIRNVFKSFPVVQEFEASSGTYGFNNPKVTLFKIR